MQKHIAVSSVLVSILAGSVAFGNVSGAISTDRFGYTGVVTRYASLADAQAGINAGATYTIGNRDLSLYIVNDLASYDFDANVIMGSWWYSTEGSDGYGNVRGNSGQGFVQLYDADGSTDTSVDMQFGGWNGTYWTSFDLNLQGTGADYLNDYARFWVDYQGGGADKVVYHEYELNLTATGLEGVENAGLIEASNHPTNVTGTYEGIFENVSTTYPLNNGFYTFSLTLDMDNWAWGVQNDLDPNQFADSYFAAPVAVPAPAGALLVLIGMPIVGWVKRRMA